MKHLTQRILFAIYDLNKIEKIYEKNSNHLMSCGSKTEQDFLESVAYGYARSGLYRLAEENYEYDNEYGFELYSALCEYAMWHKITAHNPIRMLRGINNNDIKFASDLMNKLGEAQKRLQKAADQYKPGNGDWILK